MDKPRILIIGDAATPTGFARVIRQIFTPLKDQFELNQLATRYDGGSHDYEWPLHQASKGSSVYGYDQIAPLVAETKPHIIFLLYDIPFHFPYCEWIREATRRAQTQQPAIVIYAPVEAGPIAPELIERLPDISRYVLYTEYGKRQIEEAVALIHAGNAEFSFPKLEVIPHGVETDKFFPLEPDDGSSSIPNRRLEARRRLGFDDSEHLESFIVLNANKNMARKRIDLTMQGFALFARDKPQNVKLYLHMATEDTGWNVAILAKRYGIFDRLMMTRADNKRPEFSNEEMNLLYNACDLGLTTTTGEGWGLVSFEHAATKAAQVMPRHTSLEDLWQESAVFVDPVMTLTYPGNLTEGHIVDPQDVAGALERLYTKPEYRREMAEAAYRNATRAERDWKAISARWGRLFRSVLPQND